MITPQPLDPHGPQIPVALLTDVARIKALVARRLNVSRSALDAPNRCEAPIALARQAAMYLTNVALGWPFTLVGPAFGRDRTTAAHAARVVEDRRDLPDFDRLMDELEAEVVAARPHCPLEQKGLHLVVRGPGAPTGPGSGPGPGPGPWTDARRTGADPTRKSCTRLAHLTSKPFGTGLIADI